MNKLFALVALAILGVCTVGCEQPKPAAPPPVVTTPDKPADAKPADAKPADEKPAEPAKP